MRVKIKVRKIIHETDKAVLCEIKKCPQKWIPKSILSRSKQGSYLIPESFAIKNEIPYSEWLHIPNKIEPVYNQKPIEDLKYE